VWRNSFPHVLTELAMLKIRRSASDAQNHGIIPVALDGIDFRYLPFLDGCDLFLKLKSTTSLSDLHNLFFNVLRQLFPQDHSVIDEFQHCYARVARRIQREPNIVTKFDDVVFAEITKTQDVCIENKSASIRDTDRRGFFKPGKLLSIHCNWLSIIRI